MGRVCVKIELTKITKPSGRNTKTNAYWISMMYPRTDRVRINTLDD